MEFCKVKQFKQCFIGFIFYNYFSCKVLSYVLILLNEQKLFKMKILITLCIIVGLTSEVFCLKPGISTFIESTCPAVQEKLDEVENSYNGLLLTMAIYM